MKRLPPWLRGAGVLLFIFALGFADWKTGYELNFFVFYFAPLSIAAWHLGPGTTVAMAVLCSMVWFAAGNLAGLVYPTPFIAVWNTVIRLIAFLAIGWSVSKMRSALDREHRVAESLRRALSEIKVLEAFLPICCQCKKIRNSDGSWQRLETYIGQHTGSRFSHGYCPECAQKAMAEAGLLDQQAPP